MIYKIYNSIRNKINNTYEFMKDICELPGNIKQLIKEHEYYKTEYLSLLKKYGELIDIHNELLRKII